MTRQLPTHHHHARRLACAGIALLAILALPGLARADTITSDNWSGYAAHSSGVKFKDVSATWRQPAAICTAGQETYSAFWVGIGGYSLKSDALEQLGTELDCHSNGRESMFAWYELVPAASRTVRMTVASGDLISASVSISGNRVTLRMTDATRHESFAKTITDHTIDTTSAEWITEAPSDCSGSAQCETLPLADFGGVDFSGAQATTTAGRTGSLTSSRWTTTKILLGYKKSGTSFVSESTSASATPTSPLKDGRVFCVDYAGAEATTTGSSGSGTSGTGAPTAPVAPGAGAAAVPALASPELIGGPDGRRRVSSPSSV